MKPAITIKEIASVLKSLKPTIADDYRCSNDPDDDTPGMLVTFGADETGWSYQTGDNSFHGAAYFFRNWGLAYLYRDSNCVQLAREVHDEIADAMAEMAEMEESE